MNKKVKDVLKQLGLTVACSLGLTVFVNIVFEGFLNIELPGFVDSLLFLALCFNNFKKELLKISVEFDK